MRRFWRLSLVLIWIVTLAVIGVLMWGGVLGLAYVSQDQWGGLPLTLILATFGLAFAFPLAVVVALGRRSTKLPVVKVLCVVYVELVRGVPLITLLFMASVMFPLFMPEGLDPDKLLRAQVAIILFAGAYLAEIVRGGLQALPKGQYEAADALGLSYWKKTGLIILPQALRLVIPPLVNTFIGFFKGHQPGAGDRPVRPADVRQGRDRRPDVVGVLQRGLYRPGRRLFRILLHDGPVQPRA